MHFAQGLWATVTYVVSFFQLSSFNGPAVGDQTPLGLSLDNLHSAEDVDWDPQRDLIFVPPGAPPNSTFTCNYTTIAMPGWKYCSTPNDRSCWLKNFNQPDHNITINNPYEIEVPVGVHRYYEIDATAGLTINADGVEFQQAKLFDKKYPGPWIQACWGDVSLFVLFDPAVNLINDADAGSRPSMSRSTTKCKSMGVTVPASIGMEFGSD